MFVVDTNILVYALNKASEEHAVCTRLLEGWRAMPSAWYSTWNVLYEFLRVTTHPRVFTAPIEARTAWEFLESLIAAPGFSLLVEGPRHAEVAQVTLKEVKGIRGNILYDAHTAILMREHGIRRIYTRDTDFHRFPFLEVIDPLA